MDPNKKTEPYIRQLILTVCIWIGVALIIVFIILPTLFLFAGNVFPTFISTDGALLQLNNSVNSLVGIASLIVGVVSIIYAYSSNRHMDEQQQRNEEFMKQLSEKIDDLQSDLRAFDQVLTAPQDNTKKDSSK